MKEKQKNKLKMYLEVLDILEKNNSKWKDILEFRNSVDEFVSNNDKIIELKNEFEKDLKPLISRKAAKRENLIKHAVPVCNILQVYAYDAKDDSLSKRINFTRNKLTKSKDSELVNKSRSIWKASRSIYGKSLESADSLLSKNKKQKTNSIHINAYGLTGEMIDKLENTNKAFIEAMLSLKDAISYKNRCAKKITEKIKNNDKLLHNKLDKLITIFELGDKGFYQDYKNVRTIKKEEDKAVQKPVKADVKKPVVTQNKKTVNVPKQSNIQKQDSDLKTS